MSYAMVTGRMNPVKKEKGSKILKRAGLNASQAVNLMYDRLIEEGDAGFLLSSEDAEKTSRKWEDATRFVDSLPRKRDSRFHVMTKSEIKMERLNARGAL